MTWDCFVSYASADRAHAEKLHAHLKVAGFEVWFDQYELREQLGEQWHLRIEEGCNQSRIVIPVLTPRWKHSEWTRYETYSAEAVIPWVAAGTWDEVRTPPLAQWQGDVAGVHDFEQLVESIRRLLAKPAPDYSERIAQIRYRASPYFVGRETELNDIHEKLFTAPTTVLTPGHVTAVTALGGLGKTTLARQYAEKFWRCYRELYWADCGNLHGELARIHDTIRPDPKFANLKDIDKAGWVLSELSQRERPLRLLILDNAEDEDTIKDWIPKTGNCHTIITSRFTSWSHGVDVYPVWVLEPDSARELLVCRSGCADPDNADALAKKLDYLPLALEQAAAYIAEAGSGLADYLRMYDSYERELLSFRTPGATDYPDPVYLTWRATIAKLSPGARAVLRLCSFFAPTPIPAGMLVSGATIIAQQAQNMDLLLTEEPNEFTASRWRIDLARYSMICQTTDGAFTIHALVQAVERGQTPQADRSRTIEQVIQFFMTWPPIDTEDFHNWPLWRLIEPHARALWSSITARADVQIDLKFLASVGGYLQSQAAYSDAEPMLTAVLHALTKTVGIEHPLTLMAMNNLGILYEGQGWYGEAEQLYLRVVYSRRRALGLQHRDTIDAMSNLAGLYESDGRYEDAENLHQQVLCAREQLLEPDHPETLASVNNLAFVYFRQGKNRQAEELYQRCLRGYDRVLGADDPQRLLPMNSLALLYSGEGRYKEAEGLFLRVLQSRTRVLGPNHLDTLASLGGLASLYTNLDKYEEAEAMYRQGLSVCEQQWGPDHPDTLSFAGNLGKCYQQQGRFAEALPLCQQCLDGRKRVLGPDHPNTLGAMHNLAVVNQWEGRFEEAEALYKQILPTLERDLGREHPQTLALLGNLAAVYKDLKRHDEAVLLSEECLRARERTMIPDHPNTFIASNNLADLYKILGRDEEARVLYERAVSGAERVFGPLHPTTRMFKDNLTDLRREMER